MKLAIDPTGKHHRTGPAADPKLPPRGRLLIILGVLFPRIADRLAGLLRIQGLPE